MMCVLLRIFSVFFGGGQSVNFWSFSGPGDARWGFCGFSPEHICGVLEAPQDAYWETVGPHCTHVRVWKLF